MLLIISELPGLPILIISGKDNICFESKSPPMFPVLQYEVSISDITGEQRLLKNISASANCTALGNLFDDTVCSPFNVSVRAFNENGHSRTTSLTTGNETGTDVIIITVIICRQQDDTSSICMYCHNNIYNRSAKLIIV